MNMILERTENGSVMIEGARPTTRDAGKIDFRAVHVVTEVASNRAGGSVPSTTVLANAG